MSPGAKAAWERWRQENALYPDHSPRDERIFAAGFEAALAAIERYEAHQEESEADAWAKGDADRARAYCRGKQEARNIRLWITQNISCGVSDHQQCQEANKR